MPKIKIHHDSSFWKPNVGGQSAFLDDYVHRYCALAGGWFAGKTWAGARKLAGLHLLNAFDEAGQPTFVKSAVIAPTYQLANDFDLPELRKAFGEMNLDHHFLSDPKRYCFIFPELGTRKRPSEILVRTADSPDRITGWTAGAIWGDEAARWKCDDHDPTHDPFLQADARLRDPRARFLQFLVTFTHEGDGTRVYKDFELNPKPAHVIYRAGTAQNPVAASFVETQRLQLNEEMARQYLEGVALKNGAQNMYSSFDYARNVDAALELSPDVPLQLAVDFNISPGMHAIVGQFFPQTGAGHPLISSVHEFHEMGMTVQRLVEVFAQWIARTGGWRWPGALQIYGDSTGKGRSVHDGLSCYDVLLEGLRVAGIRWQLRLLKQNPAVRDRVNAVNCALADLAGRVKYKIHPRCRRLVEDLRVMKWTESGEADKRDHKRSHASDADGYRVEYLMPIRRIEQGVGQVSVMG